MNRILLAAALVVLFTTGCQSNQNTDTGTDPTSKSSPAVTVQPTASAAPNLEATIKPTTASVQSATPSPAASPTPFVETKAKLYKMNKNYDIVPIQENGNKKVVLLTFDDAPKDKTLLTTMLDTLDKHKAKAIFFVNGYRVKKNPDLLKLIQDRGQIIGNHSWDHIDLKKETNEKVDQQVDDVQRIVKELTGSAPQFFRPPFGSGSDYLRDKLKKEHVLYMTWSNGSLDWATKTDDKSKEIINNVMNQLHFGSNILMHELPWTAETLDQLLMKLEEKGYSFVDPAAISIDGAK